MWFCGGFGDARATARALRRVRKGLARAADPPAAEVVEDLRGLEVRGLARSPEAERARTLADPAKAQKRAAALRRLDEGAARKAHKKRKKLEVRDARPVFATGAGEATLARAVEVSRWVPSRRGSAAARTLTTMRLLGAGGPEGVPALLRPHRLHARRPVPVLAHAPRVTLRVNYYRKCNMNSAPHRAITSSRLGGEAGGRSGGSHAGGSARATGDADVAAGGGGDGRWRLPGG